MLKGPLFLVLFPPAARTAFQRVACGHAARSTRLPFGILIVVMALVSGVTPGRAQSDETRSLEWQPALDATTGESATFRGAFPFMAAGALWRGESGALQLRVRADGHDWREWQEVEAEDFGSASGEAASSLLTFEPACEAQLRLAPDAPRQVPTGLRVVFIDATAGPTPSPELETAQLRAPRILSRAEWGANRRELNWTPTYTSVRKFALHHTATADGGNSPAAEVRAIYHYHAATLEWGDIGYNYVVDRAGNIYEGRAGGPNSVGAHTAGYNEGVDGIALLGSYRDRSPSDAMVASVVSLIAWRARTQGIDPLGSGMPGDRVLPNVFGHRDAGSTDCPGDAAYALLPSIRQRSAALIASQAQRPALSVSAARVTPLSISSGDTVRLDVTVVNNGTQVLRTQGPDPGTAYGEDDNFMTLGHPEQPGRIRIGVSVDGGREPGFPYRWGLGSDLAPREARTITGFIRFNRVGTHPIRIGVVSEAVEWLYEDLGRGTLSVDTPGADSYTATGSPANDLYFPLVMRSNNGWSTRLSLMNSSDQAATGNVTFVRADGGNAATTALTLPGRGSTSIDLESVGGLAAGFTGAAVVRADRPLAGVAFHQKAGSDRLSTEPFTAGAVRLNAPLAARGYNGLSSGIQVQNLGSNPTTVNVTYLADTGANWSQSARVAALASATFYAPAHPQLPDGFVGSAIIESDDRQPLAAQVNLVRADGFASAYPAQPAGNPTLSVPLLYRNRNGWTSGIQVQNVGSSATTVVATFTRTNGSGGPWEQRLTLGHAISGTFYLPANPELPDDLVASATLRSLEGQPIIALVNSVQAGKNVGTAVGGLAQPTAVLYVPGVVSYVEGWRTGVQVQNRGGEPSPVTVSFTNQSGATILQVEDVVPATGARTYYAPGIVGLPEGFNGSVVVAGRPGALLTAVVNDVR